MSAKDLERGLAALADDEVRAKVAAGEIGAAGELDLTDEERELLVAAADDEAEVAGLMINGGLVGLEVQFKGGKKGSHPADVTVNKAKTADKAFQAMDGYIRG